MDRESPWRYTTSFGESLRELRSLGQEVLERERERETLVDVF